MTKWPRSSVTTILTNFVGSSVVSAITQTPASGPLGPVTTPPRSSGSTWTAPSPAACSARVCAIATTSIAASSAATNPDPKTRFVFMARSPVDCRTLPEHRPYDEPHVRGAFGKAAHVPGEPVLTIADEDTQTGPRCRKPGLLTSLDAVQHRKLVRGSGDVLVRDMR